MGSDTTVPPKLESPEAGLLALELALLQTLFRCACAVISLEGGLRWFKFEARKITVLAGSVSTEQGALPVLIDRVVGIEDSSRYWSVWMTLEHLRIVHYGITRTMEALAAGIVLKGSASTAAVKPGPDVTAEVVDEYEQSCDRLLAKAEEITDLHTKVRYAHPWFGPLEAAGWHALSATHLGLHRVQIERIVEQIRAASPAERAAAIGN